MPKPSETLYGFLGAGLALAGIYLYEKRRSSPKPKEAPAKPLPGGFLGTPNASSSVSSQSLGRIIPGTGDDTGSPHGSPQGLYLGGSS